jgi:cyclopropane-fatty-acyl-phospholipid synthase
MNMINNKKTILNLLATAGINVNGGSPWDIQVHDEKFYDRALAGGSIGLGETYMDKLWDCEKVDEFFHRVLNANLEKVIKKNPTVIAESLITKMINRQTQSHSYKNAQRHYDIGNDLFSKMLDKRLVYTCAYWKNAANLDEAQENKLDLVCRKLGLEAGMHVADIGCGWGSFAKFAAEKYKVKVTGITVSKEQVAPGNQLCGGLPVEIKLMDYRDLTGKFDRVAAIGCLEHVGEKNHRTFMEVASRCLPDDGLFLMHTIGNAVTRTHPDPWLAKYIFPNYLVPSIRQVAKAFEGIFVMEDWQNFGTDYDKTLMAWYENFIAHYDELKDKYDERFYRMWNYYLLLCAGSFRAKRNLLWQVVFSKKGRKGVYQAVR